MIPLLSAFGTGFAVGGVFAALRLPIPAPSALAGVFGVFGITVAYLLVSRWR